MPAGARGGRHDNPMTALFVRIPSEHARRLDRAAFQLRMPKQQLVSELLERYVDPDCPSSLAGLDDHRSDIHAARRITVQAIEPDGLAVGHHSFRPRELEVLDCEEAAELLRIEPELVRSMASAGEIPGRQLAGEWRFARQALLGWLASDTHIEAREADPQPPATEPASRDR